MANLAQMPDGSRLFDQAFQTYPNAALTTQQANMAGAQAGYVGAQTTGQNIANQKSQIQLGLLQRGLADQENNPEDSQNYNQPPPEQNAVTMGDPSQPPKASQTGTPAAQGNTQQAAPAVMGPDEMAAQKASQMASTSDSWAQSTFAQHPTALPPKLAQQASLYEMAGMPEMAKAVNDLWTAKVSGVNQKITLNANQAYKNANSIIDAGTTGDAHAAFKHLEPKEYAQIHGDNLSNQDLVNFMTHAAASSFPYTNRPLKITAEGVAIDDTSAKPIPGVPKVSVSDEEKVKLAGDLMQMTDDWRSGSLVRMPMYEKLGYHNVNEALAKTLFAARGGPVPNYSGAAVSGGSNSPTGSAKDGAAPSIPGQTVPSVVNDDNSPTGKLDLSTIPKIPPLYKDNAAPNPGQVAEAQKRNDLNKVVDTDANSSVKRAQNDISRDTQILQRLPTAATGPLAAKGAELQSIAQQFRGVDPTTGSDTWSGPTVGQMLQDPASHQIVNKLLNNAGISDAENSMSSMRFSALMAKASIADLSANATLVKDAVRQMIKLDMAGSLYDKQKYGASLNAFKQTRTTEQGYGDFEQWYGTQPASNKAAAVNDYVHRMSDLGNVRPKTDLPGNDPMNNGYVRAWSESAKHYIYRDPNDPNWLQNKRYRIPEKQ